MSNVVLKVLKLNCGRAQDAFLQSDPNRAKAAGGSSSGASDMGEGATLY
jgi:hypothetical protein